MAPEAEAQNLLCREKGDGEETQVPWGPTPILAYFIPWRLGGRLSSGPAPGPSPSVWPRAGAQLAPKSWGGVIHKGGAGLMAAFQGGIVHCSIVYACPLRQAQREAGLAQAGGTAGCLSEARVRMLPTLGPRL